MIRGVAGLHVISRDGPPDDLPSHVVAAQREAFWADHDHLVAHPDQSQFVRPRIPHEFGDDGDSELTDNDVVAWVLVKREHNDPLQWHRFELAFGPRIEWNAASDDCWQWKAGREDD
jgi:hypothetical protein